jgi:hypothetical protein
MRRGLTITRLVVLLAPTVAVAQNLTPACRGVVPSIAACR